MKNFIFIFFAILSLLTSPLARTQESGDDSNKIYINVGEAKVKKSLLALPSFQLLSTASLATKHKQIGADIFNTITNDLEVSNLFTFIKQEAFLEDPAKVGLTPAPGNSGGFNFESWKKIGTDFLIRGGYKVTEASKIELEIYVYYVPQNKLIMGKKYQAEAKDARATAHTFSDDLMKALTGKKGMFKTKFAASSDKNGSGWKEIFVMDWDGRNTTGITNHRSISVSPSWSPKGKTVAYTSYAYHPALKTRNPDLFTYDIFEGKRYLVSSRRGLNSGSTFSPDGQWIYLTISSGSDPDIYKITLEGEELTQVTHGPKGTLNVEPNVAKEGNRIAFSSNRAGNPHIFTMDTDGGNIKRLTFAGKYNSSPSFSPDAKKIAFAGQDKDHFDIFIMDSDGSNMQRITSAKKSNGRWSNNEDPSFSPDGRYVVYTSNRTGANQIYISSIDGTMERRITTDTHNYYKPRWSPYLD
jgi:TolB protein